MQRSAANDTEDPRPSMVFVGAFPPPGFQAFGGHVTDCQTLMASSLAAAARIIPLDTTQLSVKRPNLFSRARGALRRITQFAVVLERERPAAAFLLAAGGLSFVEKVLLAGYSRARGVRSLFSVPSGHFMNQCRRSKVFRLLSMALLRGPNVILCQGPAWVSFFRDELAVPASRCRVLENWAASAELLSIADRRKARNTPPLTLLFIGSVARTKGVFDLLQAGARLAADASCPPFRIVIAGSGPDLDAAVAAARSLGVESRVDFVGPVFGAAKLELFRSADIFVLPSYAEGLPNAMVEAMAAGLPVVVTNVGSVPDVLIEGENGLLIAPGDKDALQGALVRLLSSSELRSTLGRSAHRLAASRFGADRAAATIYELAFSRPMPQPSMLPSSHLPASERQP
jgi:glycosyltransferase involved in cell wall biosynthesis